MSLNGKYAWITGGSRSSGRGIAPNPAQSRKQDCINYAARESLSRFFWNSGRQVVGWFLTTQTNQLTN